jgi:hypothetical protein
MTPIANAVTSANTNFDPAQNITETPTRSRGRPAMPVYR